jgi:YD repeat-containing protein
MKRKLAIYFRTPVGGICLFVLLGLAFLAFSYLRPLQAQSTVTLSSATSPASGQPGVTTITVLGSNFPSGTIAPASVTVSLQAATANAGPTATTPASAVTTILGSTRRVAFTIPASIAVLAPTAYLVSLSGATAADISFTSGNQASLTVTPSASISSLSPSTGQVGQAVTVTITGNYTNFVQGATQASFGAGVAVGGGPIGGLGPVTVTSPTTAAAQLVISPSATPGARTVMVATGVQQASLANGFTVKAAAPSPTITDFNPKSGPIGTLASVTGSNFGSAPQIAMPQSGGGTIAVPVSSASDMAVSIVIPAGALSGAIVVTNAGGSATTASPFVVTPLSMFSITATPPSVNLIQGQSVAYAVEVTSANGFNQLAQLSVSGLPSGVTATFKPQTLTAGQTSVLTLTAPANQPLSSAALSISGSATVTGIPVTQSATASLTVVAATTTLLGRTVVSDTLETQLAGVTITTLGKDGNGNTTGCIGYSAVSDAAGNFALTNLPMQCTGPQLIGFDGTTAISPPGKYAGVNLVFTLVQGQVTVSPVLVHLPRIDNVETLLVTQNAATDQNYSFASIPGLAVTVYAGTTLTLADGTQPNPFPLAAVQVPVDRLPDAKPNVPTMLRVFIVAFQPANATANQPVAVYFPNVINTPPGTDMALMTLDPTHGQMVPYGTGVVSGDGTQIVPDADPAHVGHLYGLVHFDWHGPMPPPLPGSGPSPDPCGPSSSSPVDLSSGLEVITSFDIGFNGARGMVGILRTYRTLSQNPGPFGIGTGYNYGYQLGLTAYRQGQGVITLIMPDGNQYPFTQRPDGTLVNSTIPALRGATMMIGSFGGFTLRLKNGTTLQFQATRFLAYLNSITDTNANVITLVRGNPSSPDQITQVIDPVGRSLGLTYDSSGHITSITDPIGRSVRYTYSLQGTLDTFTDPAGGVTSYAYDNQNRLTQITDARGVVVAQNTYDSNGRVIQQTQADGGVIKFAYTQLNPLVPTSPVLLTLLTDPRGNITRYRFTPNGFLLDVSDPTGQMRVFTRDSNNLVTAVSGGGTGIACGDPRSGNQAFTYDVNGNVLKWTNALGNTTTYSYDPVFNQLMSVTDSLGNVARFTYDSHGNLLTQTDGNANVTSFTYDYNGLLTGLVDAVGQNTVVSHNSSGDPVTFTNALGDSMSLQYDALSRPTLAIDSLGNTTRTMYDPLGRIVEQTNSQDKVIQLSYDAVGNLLSASDAKGNKTSHTYDPMSRLATRTSPLGKVDIRAYDLSGNVARFVDRRGQTSTFTYDVVDRLTSEIFQDGSTVTEAYDTNSRLVQVVDSLGGAFDFTYDLAGRLTKSANQFGTVQYSYDVAGRVNSRQVIGQPAVIYSHDAVGNVLSATLPEAGATFAYNARNEITTLTRRNGLTSQYTYDAIGNSVSLVHSGVAGVINSQSYVYDANGNISSRITNTSPSFVTKPFKNQYHGCPVRSRIESVGCLGRANRFGNRTLEVPVKWAFSRKA